MTQYFLFTESPFLFEKIGSTEEQIASLTQKVIILSAHLKIHKKDYASQRGLRQILGRRKRLLIYLLNKNPIKYEQVIKQLRIRGPKVEQRI
jgi:small subunit ribosomal protein S15